MIPSRILKRGPGASAAAAAKKKKRDQLKKSRTTGTLPLYQAYLGVPGAPPGFEQERQRDPYAIPKREDSVKRRSLVGTSSSSSGRVLLSQDPLIRVMMDERIDANYRSMSQTNIHQLNPAQQQNQRRLSTAQLHKMGYKKPRDRNWMSRRFRSLCACLIPRRHWNVLSRFCKLHLSSSSIGQKQGQQQQQQIEMMMQHRESVTSDAFSRDSDSESLGLSSMCCSPFRRSLGSSPTGNAGRVTNACLWHACQAITVGVLLIAIGIVMSILGFLDDQRKLEAKFNATENAYQANNYLNYVPGLQTEDRFRLNNLSFAGPVIMGLGGFIIVAACVITFETRDNAAKVAPTTSSFHGGGSQHGMHGGGHGHHRGGSRRYDGGGMHSQKAIQFRSSSSQTTILDRNIISTLGVSKSGKPVALDTAVDANRVAAANRAVTAAAKQTAAAASKPAAPVAAAKSKDHSKDSAYGYASSLATTKRASIGGTTADVDHRDAEPGLALMDEIGRRALTNAFINFIRDPSNPSSYRDSLIYDNVRTSRLESDSNEGNGLTSPVESPHSKVMFTKCPSAPNISHHKLNMEQSITIKVEAVADASPNPSHNRLPKRSSLSSTMYGQYRVLTPTMYRSRVTMAATRQAVSMDAEDRSPMRHRAKKVRRKGQNGEEEEDTVELALRPASLSPRVSLDAGTNGMAMRHQLRGRGGVGRQQQDSLELELGASATRVWNKDKEQEGGRGHSGGSASSYRGRSNNSDYYGGDTSEMTMDLHIEGSRPVTLFVRDESHSTSGRQDTNTACSTPRSNGRSPIHSLLQPQPHQQHSKGGGGVREENVSPMSASLALQIVKQDEEARVVKGSGRPYSALANTEEAKSKRQNEEEDLSQIKRCQSLQTGLSTESEKVDTAVAAVASGGGGHNSGSTSGDDGGGQELILEFSSESSTACAQSSNRGKMTEGSNNDDDIAVFPVIYTVRKDPAAGAAAPLAADDVDDLGMDPLPPLPPTPPPGIDSSSPPPPPPPSQFVQKRSEGGGGGFGGGVSRRTGSVLRRQAKVNLESDQSSSK